MRHHLTLTVALGALLLAACSDDNRPTPTGPGPEFDKGVPCPTTAFPLQGPTGVNAQITALYPTGTLRTAALAKAADIAKKWSQCKVADPQEKVIAFINQLLADFRALKLIGGTSPATAGKVATLINTMLAGVNLAGAPFPAAPDPDLDFGAGFFTPGTPLLVKSSLGDGAVRLAANAFTIPTAITILRLPPANNPFASTGETVLPPYFEITASNSQGKHYLSNGKAIVGFCVDIDLLNSLNQPAIAHIAVAEGANPGGFERLDDATAAQFNSLNLTDCAPLPTSLGAAFDGGLSGLSDYASATVRSILLPRRLEAAVGKTGLGGLATSLSPFGVTDRSPTQANHIDIRTDPGNDHYYKNGTLDTCHDGCEPDVQILDAENVPVGVGTQVTVSLLQTAGTGGVLSGTLTRPIGEGGSASFEDLKIDKPGTYQLVFSAPGAQSATTDAFQVYELAFQTQPTASPGQTVFGGDFLGQTVAGFDNPVVQVKIIDFSGNIVTSLSDFVRMSITSGQLNGTTAVQAVSGVASFTEIGSDPATQSGLTVDTDGQLLENLQLQAKVFGEEPVLSTVFTVDGRTF
jgi:hypothetical protein